MELRSSIIFNLHFFIEVHHVNIPELLRTQICYIICWFILSLTVSMTLMWIFSIIVHIIRPHLPHMILIYNIYGDYLIYHICFTFDALFMISYEINYLSTFHTAHLCIYIYIRYISCVAKLRVYSEWPVLQKSETDKSHFNYELP